jgi:hypothetical protein
MVFIVVFIEYHFVVIPSLPSFPAPILNNIRHRQWAPSLIFGKIDAGHGIMDFPHRVGLGQEVTALTVQVWQTSSPVKQKSSARPGGYGGLHRP